MIYSASAGVGYELSRRFRLALDVFHSPLPVSRAAGAPITNDGLLNVRTLLGYDPSR